MRSKPKNPCTSTSGDRSFGMIMTAPPAGVEPMKDESILREGGGTGQRVLPNGRDVRPRNGMPGGARPACRFALSPVAGFHLPAGGVGRDAKPAHLPTVAEQGGDFGEQSQPAAQERRQ